ncbi:uncharacterized protein Dwil_GK16936 [Drosophila willistoni]|uniref:Gamma-tubulin complex component 6 n=1 Tax=Drosophila willistoni TaxID=7260 RepID=B4MKX0_DROWI|nr:uncharacterized protein LOC6639551 [Drosophila willistoni]EDW72895.1 uncharacterized protein Dwil_GK16936 [Drosophila willistoni]
MAGTDVCTSSIFGLVTQLARFLCHGEAYFNLNRDCEPTDATVNSDVAKRRIQIYEALLMGNGGGSKDNDENGDGDGVESQLQQFDNPELLEMHKLIEEQVDQQLGQKIAQLLLTLSNPTDALRETSGVLPQKTGIKMRLLKPKPFKLEEQPEIEVMPTEPKMFRSVGFMRSQTKPLDYQFKSNLITENVRALRETLKQKAINAATGNADKLVQNVFQDSVSRIRDYKDRVRPICPRVKSNKQASSSNSSIGSGGSGGVNMFQESMARINELKEQDPVELKKGNMFKDSKERLKETNGGEVEVYHLASKVSSTSLDSLTRRTSELSMKTPAARKALEPKIDLSFKPRPEKSFLSDLNITNDIKMHFDPNLELKYIKLPDLIEHLKFAAAGLQSETFSFVGQDSFHINPNCTLATVLPEVLADFAVPFLESGWCYRRLTMRTQWVKPHLMERPLNRTLRKSIIAFLTTNRQFLLCQPAKELSQLVRSSLIAMQLMHHLEALFQSQPILNLRTGTPGAFLISFMWSTIESCNNSKFLQLLIHLFKSICVTYYGQLENWVFRGRLDDTFNELFISRSALDADLLDERSKEFFDKGYRVIDGEVPGFLHGCQQAILQCGKYNQVLKAYNAQHPILEWKFPSIVVCVTEEQVDKMRSTMQCSYTPILQRYEKCSMQSIFEQRLASKHRFGNRMVEQTQAHLINWERQQHELFLKATAKSQQLCDELNAQMEEQRQRRIEQRRLEIAQELAIQRRCEQQKEIILQREKDELLAEIAKLQGMQKLKEDVNYKEDEETEADGKTETEEVFSPDQSSSSGRSFVSCLEGPPSIDMETEAATPLPHSAPEYQRSHSDVINSNDAMSTSDSISSRNRQHIMSSEQFQECYLATKVVLPSPAATAAEADVNMNVDPLATDNLSDMQRNRQRVMCHDGFVQFNAEEDTHSNRVKFQIESTTELAQNRRRVMASEFDIVMSQPEATGKWKRTESDDLQQNRHRVMESHFDIGIESVDDKKLNLRLDVNRLQVELPTPMSTTSDVEIEEKYADNSSDDLANNNYDMIGNEDQQESPTTSPTIPKPAAPTLDPTPNSIPVHMPPEQTRPSYHIPSNIGLRTETNKREWDTVTKASNPYMIRRCLQMSIMIPLNTHLSLLRSEIFRIFKDLRIYDHFRQLRNYFFLLDGQFSMLLAQGILGHINKGLESHRLCQRGLLDGILNNAINAGGTDETAISQNLSFSCLEVPEGRDLMPLDVLSMLTLETKIDWPLNLVISSETIRKYGEIFRHFFKLRQIDYVLQCSYEFLHEQGKLHGRRLCIAPHYRHLQMMRHKLSHFVTTLQNHLVSTALQAPWKIFKDEMRTADSIETLYRQHVSYLKRVAFMALINRHSSKIKETVDSILVIVLRFCKVLQTQTFTLDAENQFVHPRYKRLVYEETEFNKFMQYLIYLGNKVATSGYQEEIGDLIRIINYNNYYKLSTTEGDGKF